MIPESVITMPGITDHDPGIGDHVKSESVITIVRNTQGSRIKYSFNTRMFLNAFLQYNTDAKQFSSNIRFRLIHHPLSDLFIVYNDRRDTQTGELLDRAIIFKFTNLFNF